LKKISLELDKEELDLLYLGIAKLYLREKKNIPQADLYHRMRGVHTTDILYYEKLLDKLLKANIQLDLNEK
jgi:hypothetical protein